MVFEIKAVPPAESVSCTVKAYDPAEVGVPDNNQVSSVVVSGMAAVKPGGKVDGGTSDHE